MLAENKRLLGQRQRTIIHSISSSQSIVLPQLPLPQFPQGTQWGTGDVCTWSRLLQQGNPALREPKSFIMGSEPAWMLPWRDTIFILLNDKQTWLVFFEGKHSIFQGLLLCKLWKCSLEIGSLWLDSQDVLKQGRTKDCCLTMNAVYTNVGFFISL